MPPATPPAVEHGHPHGRVDASIKRSREGIRAVAASLAWQSFDTVREHHRHHHDPATEAARP